MWELLNIQWSDIWMIFRANEIITQLVNNFSTNEMRYCAPSYRVYHSRCERVNIDSIVPYRHQHYGATDLLVGGKMLLHNESSGKWCSQMNFNFQELISYVYSEKSRI